MQSLLDTYFYLIQARLAQSVERQALNLVADSKLSSILSSFCVISTPIFIFLPIFFCLI